MTDTRRTTTTEPTEPTEPVRTAEEPTVVRPAGSTSVTERETDTVVTDRTTDVGLQEQRFGGFKLGAAFFGWLSAMGLAVILVGLLAAAGAALALSDDHPRRTGLDNAQPITIGAGIALVVVLCIAYFAGGYVAGRMARFSGAANGFGVWLIGVIVTAALAAAGAAFGSQYNVLERFDLPRVPIDEGSLTTGGAVTLAAVVIGTLIAALLGGKAGEAYHRRIDRAGAVDWRDGAVVER